MNWVYGLVDFEMNGEVQSDGRCVTTAMRKYLVRTDAEYRVSELDVALAVGIKRGSPLPEYQQAICLKASVGPGPVMTRPPYQAFYATYHYSTNAPLPPEVNDDPTSMRTRWSIAPQIQSRYVIRDRSGDLIVNGAGTPFDGGIPVDVRLGSVTAKKNRSAVGYNKDLVLANSGKLNKETYLGGDPGTVQVDISAEEVYEGNYHYWAETYTFSYDPLGWQPKPVNAGFFRREDVGSNVLLRILNQDIGDTSDPTSPVQEPEPLDDDGLLVAVSARPSGCTFIEVDYFDEMDFEVFDL